MRRELFSFLPALQPGPHPNPRIRRMLREVTPVRPLQPAGDPTRQPGMMDILLLRLLNRTVEGFPPTAGGETPASEQLGLARLATGGTQLPVFFHLDQRNGGRVGCSFSTGPSGRDLLVGDRPAVRLVSTPAELEAATSEELPPTVVVAPTCFLPGERHLPRAVGRLRGARSLAVFAPPSVTGFGALENLEWLWHLTLCAPGLNFPEQVAAVPDLPSLSLVNTAVRDLSFLRGTASLRALHLAGNLGLVHLRGVEDHASLEHLAIDGCLVGDLQALGRANGLQSLRLENCPRITSLPAIPAGGELRSLAIIDCPRLGDTSRFAAARSLRLLHLEGQHATPLPPLLAQRGLESLRLVNCNLHPEDLEGALRNENLAELDLAGNPMVDPGRLAMLTRLRRLSLDATGLAGPCRSLARLRELEDLSLALCGEPSPPDWLGELAGLTHLDLAGYHPSGQDLAALGRLPRLECLGLAGWRRLESLEALAPCTRLWNIDLRGCVRVADVQPVLGRPHSLVLYVDRGSPLATGPEGQPAGQRFLAIEGSGHPEGAWPGLFRRDGWDFTRWCAHRAGPVFGSLLAGRMEREVFGECRREARELAADRAADRPQHWPGGGA